MCTLCTLLAHFCRLLVKLISPRILTECEWFGYGFCCQQLSSDFFFVLTFFVQPEIYYMRIIWISYTSRRRSFQHFGDLLVRVDGAAVYVGSRREPRILIASCLPRQYFQFALIAIEHHICAQRVFPLMCSEARDHISFKLESDHQPVRVRWLWLLYFFFKCLHIFLMVRWYYSAYGNEVTEQYFRIITVGPAS